MAQFNEVSAGPLLDESFTSNGRVRGGFAFDLCSRDQQIGGAITAAGGRMPAVTLCAGVGLGVGVFVGFGGGHGIRARSARSHPNAFTHPRR